MRYCRRAICGHYHYCYNMAKKRGRKPFIGRKMNQVEDDEIEGDIPDPKSNEFYYDEIDNLNSEKEKILLEKGAPLPHQNEDSEENEEAVMGLDLSDDEQDVDVDSDLAEDINMDSDLEDEDDGMPSDKAWGKKKKLYYNTDYTDKDYMGMTGTDGEAAEAEEREALALQKKMAQTLQDADFGLSDFVQVNKKVTEDTRKKVIKNLSKISKKEKLQLLTKESPEFLGIIEDFNAKFSELIRIQPIMALVDEGKIPKSAGALYVKTKHPLLLMYLTNISFYFMLKACHNPIQNHPVVKRLVEYRMLLQQLENVDEKLKPEIDNLLKCIEDGEEIPIFTESSPDTFSKNSAENTPSLIKKIKQKSHEEILQTDKSVSSPVEAKKKKSVKFLVGKKQNNETEDEKIALNMYSMMKGARRKGKEMDKEIEDACQDSVSEDEEMETFYDDKDAENENIGDQNADYEEDKFDGKRGITYQIAKNKGVTPRRKKEQRNPRVKHRTKFRKAKVRRKGQVREPRLEINKYGGEISGIRAGVRHSIKLK